MRIAIVTACMTMLTMLTPPPSNICRSIGFAPPILPLHSAAAADETHRPLRTVPASVYTSGPRDHPERDLRHDR
jgi:hypothetical protein